MDPSWKIWIGNNFGHLTLRPNHLEGWIFSGWMSCLEALKPHPVDHSLVLLATLRLAKSLQNMETQESCKRQRTSWWSWCHFFLALHFFSATPFFLWKKNQGNPEFLGALNFIIEFFWGVVFWSSNRGCTSPRDWWHPSELTQIIDQPAEIPYPNHIPGLKTHSLGLGLG